MTGPTREPRVSPRPRRRGPSPWPPPPQPRARLGRRTRPPPERSLGSRNLRTTFLYVVMLEVEHKDKSRLSKFRAWSELSDLQGGPSFLEQILVAVMNWDEVHLDINHPEASIYLPGQRLHRNIPIVRGVPGQDYPSQSQGNSVHPCQFRSTSQMPKSFVVDFYGSDWKSSVHPIALIMPVSILLYISIPHLLDRSHFNMPQRFCLLPSLYSC